MNKIIFCLSLTIAWSLHGALSQPDPKATIPMDTDWRSAFKREREFTDLKASIAKVGTFYLPQIQAMKSFADFKQYMLTADKKTKKFILLAIAHYNCPSIMQFLLDNGADVNTDDDYGFTLLHEAAKADYAQVVRLLLDNGAKVDAKQSDGYTPLHIATLNGNAHVMQVLLAHDATNANTNALYGVTPLHLAVFAGKTAVIPLLLAYGADVTLRTDAGDRAIDLARKDKKHDLVAILQAAESALPSAAAR